MSTRTFQPRDLVALPALSAEDAYALVSSLLTTATAVGAPASVAEVLEEMRESRGRLRSQLVLRRTAPGADPKAAIEADARVDAAWSALRDWLSGWVKLGEGAPRGSEIRELHAFLFGEGLAFLNLRYRKQWTESETRVGALRTTRNTELVRELGGAPFLTVLFAAHDAYGSALSITEVATAPTDARVRESFEAVAASIRAYVVAVAGTVRKSRPSSAERAEQLLRPLSEWETSREGAGGTPAVTPPPSGGGTPPVTPTT